MELNLQGLIIGLSSFLVIGIFHPLVIKGEYYYGQKINWAFAIAGVITLVFALLCDDLLWSAILAVVAFSCFWSIHEVAAQKRRVERGWFAMNPKRRHEYNLDNATKPSKHKALQKNINTAE